MSPIENNGSGDKTFATLLSVCREFLIEGNMIDYKEITIGNVNYTYQVNFDDNKSYILQRLNTFVFKEPRHIMSNIDLVTTYIRNQAKETNSEKPTLHFHHLSDGSNYCFADDNTFWRLCNNIDSVTYNTCNNLDILRSAGRAFGMFQNQLADFDPRKLYETIPDFHNTKKRLDDFFANVEKDICGRVKEVLPEIEYIKSVADMASNLSIMQENKEIPLRVTHNDTKTNNVLFDKDTNEPIAVIDLDTVMPGLAVHDFGDAVRSAACTTDEDEKDLTKVALNLEKYTAFAEGFIGETACVLSKIEIDNMALGAFTIAVELGVRFLNDYIMGDIYFKTRYKGHNIDRARCQLKLAADMQTKKDEMQKIVIDISKKSKGI